MFEDMAAKGAFPVKVDSDLRGIAIVLKSVACEWLLLFFLLLDAAFSYFLTKFAQYCDLQVPCILCSRLDHIFGEEKPHFYRNLICSDHKVELSSLTLCHNHGKLADVHEMCEECILSFAKNDPNQELYKLLVGKLQLDCLQKPFVSMDSHMRSCSCCTKHWRSRPNLQKFVQSKLHGHASKPDIPLPKSPVNKSLNRQEGLKKRKDKLSPLATGRTYLNKEKVNIDSVTDFPFSDDDDMINVLRYMKNGRDDYLSYLGPKSPKNDYNEIYPVRLLNRTLATGNIMHSNDEPEYGETTTPTCIPSSRHETSLQQVCTKPSPTLSKIVPLDDVPLSSSSPEISPDSKGEAVSDHSNGLEATLVKKWESIDLDSNSTEIGKGTDDIIRKDVALLPNNSSSLDDIASTTTKQVEEATELLPEQISSWDLNGIGSNEGSLESSKSPKVEKSRSPRESLKESVGGNGDDYREELEHSRKCIESLRKELEEERNASTVSANQAMAMITKLQEEKAALNMESLQYLRMMEEQAEYDMEALERANDLVAEKEKEMQDLEAELDYFRIKYPEDFPEYLEMLEKSEDIDQSQSDANDFES